MYISLINPNLLLPSCIYDTPKARGKGHPGPIETYLIALHTAVRRQKDLNAKSLRGSRHDHKLSSRSPGDPLQIGQNRPHRPLSFSCTFLGVAPRSLSRSLLSSCFKLSILSKTSSSNSLRRTTSRCLRTFGSSLANFSTCSSERWRPSLRSNSRGKL